MASEHATAGARYMREYVRRKGDMRSRSDLSRALFVAAQAKRVQGDMEAALAGFAECDSILQNLRQQAPADVELRREIALGLLVTASIEGGSGLNLGRLGPALAHLRSAVTIFRELALAGARNMSAKVDLANAMWELGMLQPPEEGMATLREALAIMSEVPRTMKGSKRWAGRIRVQMSTLLRVMGPTAEARQLPVQAEADFAGENLTDPLVRGDALVLWQEQAESALAGHQPDKAITALRQITEAYTTAPKSPGDAFGQAYYLALLARAPKPAETIRPLNNYSDAPHPSGHRSSRASPTPSLIEACPEAPVVR